MDSKPPTAPSDTVRPQPIAASTTGLKTMPRNGERKKRRNRLLVVISIVAALLVGAGIGSYAWYQQQLTPVNKDDTSKQVVAVEVGTTPQAIADMLEQKGIIRSSFVFMFQTRIEGVQNKLQAGSYRLSASESTPEIIAHLVNGKTDTFSLTFLPGSTLAQNREVLISAGFEQSEVDAALKKTYSSPLFAGKPATADLEGYIYGETYSFAVNTTAEAVLEHVFGYYSNIIVENDLADAYARQGLSLYEGITLASIVQREASVGGDDMPKIAQVFYSRLAIGMPLGSDVTYQYIADKTGVPRSTDLDSPYNTRRYAGLPPGPISVPGLKALKAVAQPADTDYLFFLSGDDNVTYFARSAAEHEANITNHCQEKCKII